MFRPLWQHIRSNVIGVIALTVALGGTASVAALRLAPGSVTGREVKDGSLGKKELSNSARHALRGQRGPQGAVGPQGPVGPGGAPYFATVLANGTRVAGNATGGGTAEGLGHYVVEFGRSMAGCVPTVTLGTNDSSSTEPGRATANVDNGLINVRTYATDGSPAALPFHLLAAC